MAEVHDDELFESGSSTQLEVIKLKYTWTINNFMPYYENEFELISPTFSSGINNDKSRWCLILNPKSGRSEDTSCQLKLVESHMNELYAQFNLHIVNAKGKNLFSVKNASRFVKNSVWSTDDFVESRFIIDNKLIIVCKLNYMVSVNSKNISSRTLKIALNSQAIDFSFLFENKELSDLTLSVDGKEFPAHKVILAARSSVFRAMFRHDMEESRNNRVEITDTDEESLCEMLRYMYTGKVHKLETIAPRLLGIAEKYAMNDFKIICENALLKNVSLENVVEYFILSDMFLATELKNEVKKFIVSHAAAVANLPEFQAMVRTHPHLGIEAFCVITNK